MEEQFLLFKEGEEFSDENDQDSYFSTFHIDIEILNMKQFK